MAGDGRGSSKLTCPRCGAGVAEAKRWGRFAGRQRYRCRRCGRTFTSLTGAPQACLKHQAKWPKLGRCLKEKLTVREAARRLGVAPSTSFRWRHRYLASLVNREARPVFRGIVEVAETYYPEGHKGERYLRRPARRRGMVRTILRRDELICVVLACDRQGQELLEPACRGVPKSWALAEVLGGCLTKENVVCTERYYWYQTFFRQVGLRHRVVLDLTVDWIQEELRRGLRTLSRKDRAYHINRASGMRRALQRWLGDFRGVSARYLRNYLAWFRQPSPGFA